ncbi:MAG: metallophosphoesterase [Ignavibacteriales bacterium]|nr:MAG: metallophosphoesterase [Ignavibacteriales bacterium]
MRFAHISDLHLCTKHKSENIPKIKRLIQHALDNGAQHFVITGDISDNADEKDFVVFKEILKKFDLLRSDKTTIIIGNHDIFGGPQTAQDVFNFPAKCMNTNYHERVAKFIDHFKELFVNTIRLHDELYFPFAKEFKDVLLVGINSAAEYSRFKNPFASNGHVSKTQRQFLKAILTKNEFKNKVKIILTHHHFYPKNVASHSSERTMWNKIENYTMKLRGKKKLLKLFLESNVKLVLHGHSHEMKEYFREGIRFINSGGSVDNGLKDETSLFLIDVFPFEVTAEISKPSLKSQNITTQEKLVVSLAS